MPNATPDSAPLTVSSPAEAVNVGVDKSRRSIEQASIEHRFDTLAKARPKVPNPRWTTFARGGVYRPVMRLMHRLGWCYPCPVKVEPGCVWCHWCGMRGRR